MHCGPPPAPFLSDPARAAPVGALQARAALDKKEHKATGFEVAVPRSPSSFQYRTLLWCTRVCCESMYKRQIKTGAQMYQKQRCLWCILFAGCLCMPLSASATEYAFSTYGLGAAAFGAGVTPPPGTYVTGNSTIFSGTIRY